MADNYKRGMGEDVIRSLDRAGLSEGMRANQMDLSQGISDQIRRQGPYANPRQGIKMDPTDDAHETTHRAPGDE